MDKEEKIKSVLKRDLSVGETVTERKISQLTKNLIESVDWGDAKDRRQISTNQKKSVDWSDGKDRKP